MRGPLRRRGEQRLPADVRRLLPPGDGPLAFTRAADGTWLVGSRAHLLLVGPAVTTGTTGAGGRTAERGRLIPWERVDEARWDRDESRLRLSELAEYGEPQPSYSLEIEEPGRLLELLRERVTASIVLQRRVTVSGRRGLSVIGRRSPAGGAITWMHAYDPGVDPDDPAVRTLAEQALLTARREVGELG